LKDCECFGSVDAAVLGLLLVTDTFEFEKVLALFFLEHVELFSYAAFFVFE